MSDEVRGQSIAVLLEIIILFSAFRSEDAAKYMAEKPEEGKTNISQLAVIVQQPSVWMCAAYFLADVGTESTFLPSQSSMDIYSTKMQAQSQAGL